MGKYIKGILGSFTGQVGTVVGSSWKGIEVMKSLSKTIKKPPTARQIAQRARFSFVAAFIKPLSKLFDVSYIAPGSKMSAVNAAFQYNYDHALGGTYPAFTFDYSKVLISKGNLHPANTPAAAAAGTGIIKFTWGDNSGVALANATDKCIMVVHCAELNRSLYKTGGAARPAGTDAIDAGIFSGRVVETWLAFITEDGTDVSSSNYTGQLTVA